MKHVNAPSYGKCARSVDRRPGRRPSAAFTLVELLIAASLMTLLLAALWSMLFQTRGLSRRGRKELQEHQLLRSLSQLWSEDLSAVSELPAMRAEAAPGSLFAGQGPPPADGAASNGPQIQRLPNTDALPDAETSKLPTSLALPIEGGPDYLIVRRLSLDSAWRQPASLLLGTVDATTETNASPARTMPGATASTSPRAGQVSSYGDRDEVRPLAFWREIRYQFVDPLSAPLEPATRPRAQFTESSSREFGFAQRPGGLVRIDRPWLPSGLQLNTGAGGPSRIPEPAALSGAANAALSSEPQDSGAPDPSWDAAMGSLDESREAAPEVTRLAFRYFDGRQWTDVWSRVALPVAVEVSFDLDIEAGSEDNAKPSHGPQQAPASDLRREARPSNERQRPSASDPWTPQYRLVFRVGAGVARSAQAGERNSNNAP